MDQTCVSCFPFPPSFAFESQCQCQGCSVPTAPYIESGSRSHQYLCGESKEMSGWLRGGGLAKNTRTRADQEGFL